jgi:putative flippase GtrA
MVINPALREFLRYCIVGGVGFVVDGGLLWWLTADGVASGDAINGDTISGDVVSGFDPYLARLISFPVAVTVTWILHRFWTFERGRDTAAKRQYAGYFILQLAANLINYSAYAAALSLYGTSQIILMLGFTFGSAIGLAVNYTGAKWLYR